MFHAHPPLPLSSCFTTTRLSATCKQARRLHHTLDLPSIQLQPRQLLQIVVPDITSPWQFDDEVRPDLATGGEVEGWVREPYVNAGVEGEVQGGDAVGCQDHDAVKIFEFAEEDYQGVLVSEAHVWKMIVSL